MRVFVTGTGRCGSVTFARAAGHLTNYTAAHETHWGRQLPPPAVDYPDNHVEVAPQLVYFLPDLVRRYPGSRWVHLIRNDRAACVESMADWCRPEMAGFGRQWFNNGDAVAGARAFYAATNDLIEALVPAALRFEIEQPARGWPVFWNWIAGEGNYEAGLREFRTRHNARKRR